MNNRYQHPHPNPSSNILVDTPLADQPIGYNTGESLAEGPPTRAAVLHVLHFMIHILFNNIMPK